MEKATPNTTTTPIDPSGLVPNAGVAVNGAATIPANGTPLTANTQAAAVIPQTMAPLTAQQMQTQSALVAQNQWRYQYHNNQWWYYMPQNYWMYYDGAIWRSVPAGSAPADGTQGAVQTGRRLDAGVDADGTPLR